MIKHAAIALSLAALACAPALAEGGKPVASSSGASVTSGTGVLVTPGVPTGVAVAPAVPAAAVTITPGAAVALPNAHLLPGAATVQASSTTTLGGPAGTASGSKTVVTHYWVNVPADVERRGDFRRWMALK